MTPEERPQGRVHYGVFCKATLLQDSDISGSFYQLQNLWQLFPVSSDAKLFFLFFLYRFQTAILVPFSSTEGGSKFKCFEQPRVPKLRQCEKRWRAPLENDTVQWDQEKTDLSLSISPSPPPRTPNKLSQPKLPWHTCGLFTTDQCAMAHQLKFLL